MTNRRGWTSRMIANTACCNLSWTNMLCAIGTFTMLLNFLPVALDIRRVGHVTRRVGRLARQPLHFHVHLNRNMKMLELRGASRLSENSVSSHGIISSGHVTAVSNLEVDLEYERKSMVVLLRWMFGRRMLISLRITSGVLGITPSCLQLNSSASTSHLGGWREFRTEAARIPRDH